MSTGGLAEVVRKRVQEILDENKRMGRHPKNRSELAAEMDISREGIRRTLSPEGGMTVKTIENLAEALKVPAWKLLAPEGTNPAAAEDLNGEPTIREVARVVRFLLRQDGGEAYLRELVEAHSPASPKTKKG